MSIVKHIALCHTVGELKDAIEEAMVDDSTALDGGMGNSVRVALLLNDKDKSKINALMIEDGYDYEEESEEL